MRPRRPTPGLLLLALALGLLLHGCFPCQGSEDLSCRRMYVFGDDHRYQLSLDELADTALQSQMDDNLKIPLGQQVLLLEVTGVDKAGDDGSTRYSFRVVRHVPGGSLGAPECAGKQTFDGLRATIVASLQISARVCVRDEVGTYAMCPEVDCAL